MVTTIGLVGHVAGLIGQHHWNTHLAANATISTVPVSRIDLANLPPTLEHVTIESDFSA